MDNISNTIASIPYRPALCPLSVAAVLSQSQQTMAPNAYQLALRPVSLKTIPYQTEDTTKDINHWTNFQQFTMTSSDDQFLGYTDDQLKERGLGLALLGAGEVIDSQYLIPTATMDYTLDWDDDRPSLSFLGAGEIMSAEKRAQIIFASPEMAMPTFQPMLSAQYQHEINKKQVAYLGPEDIAALQTELRCTPVTINPASWATGFGTNEVISQPSLTFVKGSSLTHTTADFSFHYTDPLGSFQIATNKPSTTFHGFPNLPFEIRCMIWGLSRAPRIVKIDIKVHKIAFTKKIRISHFESKTPNPALLSVCRESRLIATQWYQPAFYTSMTANQSLILFDLNNDIAFFNMCSAQYTHGSILRKLPKFLKQCSSDGVKKVALNNHTFEELGSSIIGCLERLMGVKEIIAIIYRSQTEFSDDKVVDEYVRSCRMMKDIDGRVLHLRLFQGALEPTTSSPCYKAHLVTEVEGGYIEMGNLMDRGVRLPKSERYLWTTINSNID